MQYNIGTQVFCFLVLLIFTAAFFSKSRLKNISNQIYGILLIKLLIVNFLDIGSVIAIVHQNVSGSLTDFFSKGYLCMMVAWLAMVSIYTLSMTGVVEYLRKRQPLLKALIIAAGLTVLAVCLWIIKEKLYYFSIGGNAYSYGRGVDILYGFGLISILFCFVVVIIETKKIPFIRKLSIYLYIGILVTATLIQKYYPTILLTSAASTLSMVFMYFTLENPDLELIAELDEAKKTAEEANQTKANFIANMSYGIRTPVNAIISMNEMILKENNSEEVENYALQIEQAGHSLLSITNDILDISKIESGKIEIVPIKYLTCSMVQELYSMHRLAAERKKLKLYVNLDTEYPRILYGDEVRVKQIITNLLSNAVKYTQQGHIIFSFSYEKLDSKKLDMIVKVSDTGQGIKEEHRQDLFEAFNRMEEEKSSYIEGLGLGLTITKQLLEQMNGSIEIESEYGKGSTFTVHIPQEIVDDTPIGELEVNDLQTYLRQAAEIR